jgi:hypothetical protein
MACMALHHEPDPLDALIADEWSCWNPDCEVCWLWLRDGETKVDWLARITLRSRAVLDAAPPVKFGRSRSAHP